jgi:hypothetical protein
VVLEHVGGEVAVRGSGHLVDRREIGEGRAAKSVANRQPPTRSSSEKGGEQGRSGSKRRAVCGMVEVWPPASSSPHHSTIDGWWRRRRTTSLTSVRTLSRYAGAASWRSIASMKSCQIRRPLSSQNS